MKRLILPLLCAASAAFSSPTFAQSGGDQTNSGFADWLVGFRAEARAAGISDATLDSAFTGIKVNERVFSLNDNQPEFSRAIWDYLDTAVSDTKVEKGRTKFADERIALALIEEAYGVDAELIVSIWGMETAYGAILGNYDAIEALATLAYSGRRTAFGRAQLIGALKIIENGYATRDELKGSWAGAMGHTQFIPTTYLAYAVDHDSDGRRDIWANLGDVFASTANYLRSSKYQHNQPWGVEVRLPSDFDYALADHRLNKPVAQWLGLGIEGIRPNGLSQIDPNKPGRVLVPAGHKGPAFIVFANFEAIMAYNRSTSYALAVAMLSDEIAGRPGRSIAAWPRSDRALSLSERKSLQSQLAQLGYAPGPIDGIIGAGTRRAIRAFQLDNALPADGYASSGLMEQLSSVKK